MADDQKLSVLVVDDTPGAAQNLATLVESWGYTVVFATDGASALAVAETAHPDIALLDLNMPDQHGYDVAKQLRAQAGERTMHFVAITGWNQIADQLLSAAAGISHHLVKPVNHDVLKKILADYQAMARAP